MSGHAETATERAYAHVKSRVLDGRIAGGELISEGDVAAEIGLSRTPVREAFLRLEAESLLKLYPKRGAFVVPVSTAEVEDVMETRLVIERFAVEKIGRGSDALVDQLHAELTQQETIAQIGDTLAFVTADREFHRLLVATTGNTILLSLHDSLRDRQSRMGLTALASQPGRMLEILDEHRAIAAALATGAPAGQILQDHLAKTLALLRAQR